MRDRGRGKQCGEEASHTAGIDPLGVSRRPSNELQLPRKGAAADHALGVAGDALA